MTPLTPHHWARTATAIASMAVFAAVFFELPASGVLAVVLLCLLTLSATVWVGRQPLLVTAVDSAATMPRPRAVFLRAFPWIALGVASLSCGGDASGPTLVPNAPSGWVGDFTHVFHSTTAGAEHKITVVGVAFWLVDDELAPVNPADRSDTFYKTTAGGGMRVTYEGRSNGPGGSCTGTGQLPDVKLGPSDGQLTVKRSGTYSGFIRHSGIDVAPYVLVCVFEDGSAHTTETSMPNVEFRLEIAGSMLTDSQGLRMAASPPATTNGNVTVTRSWDFGSTSIPPL